MKKFFRPGIIIAFLLTFGILAGCGDDDTSNRDELKVETINVNGETVNCVVYDDNRFEQGGVSCDWSNGAEDSYS